MINYFIRISTITRLFKWKFKWIALNIQVALYRWLFTQYSTKPMNIETNILRMVHLFEHTFKMKLSRKMRVINLLFYQSPKEKVIIKNEWRSLMPVPIEKLLRMPLCDWQIFHARMCPIYIYRARPLFLTQQLIKCDNLLICRMETTLTEHFVQNIFWSLLSTNHCGRCKCLIFTHELIRFEKHRKMSTATIILYW